MPKELESEFLNEEFNESYRDFVKKSLGIADGYNGNEAELNELIDYLSDLEKWMQDVFGGEPLTIEREEVIARNLNEESINSILDIAHDNFERTMKGMQFVDLPCNKVFIKGVLIPPDPNKIVEIPNGLSDSFELGKEVPRLQELVVFLESKGIYLDDLTIISGEVDSNSMRKSTYYIVEIPRLEKSIAVCNLTQQATFVFDGIIGKKTFLKYGKDELVETLGAIRVSYYNKTQWDKRLNEALALATKPAKNTKKIDIADLEEVKKELLAKFPTSKDWFATTSAQRRNLELKDGRKFSAMAGVFGVGRTKGFSLLGRATVGMHLYGGDDELVKTKLNETLEIEEYRKYGKDPEIWKGLVKDEFTPAQWIEHDTTTKRRNIRVKGKTLSNLRTIFGLQLEDASIEHIFLKLGLIIFGEDEPLILAALEKAEIQVKGPDDLGKDPDKWRKALQAKYTIEEILNLSTNKRQKFSFREFSSFKICTILGVRDFARFGYDSLVDFTEAIWGKKNKEIVQARKEAEAMYDPEKMREFLREKFTAKEWVNLSHKSKKTLKVGKHYLSAIATLFGLNLDPVDSHFQHIELGMHIFTDEDIENIIKPKFEEMQSAEKIKKDPANLKQAIRDKYTYEEFSKIQVRGRRNIEIYGLKLTTIATALGIKGNPYNNQTYHKIIDMVFS